MRLESIVMLVTGVPETSMRRDYEEMIRVPLLNSMRRISRNSHVNQHYSFPAFCLASHLEGVGEGGEGSGEGGVGEGDLRQQAKALRLKKMLPQ